MTTDIVGRLVQGQDGKLASSRTVFTDHSYAQRGLIDQWKRVPSMQPARFSKKRQAREEEQARIVENIRGALKRTEGATDAS